MSETLPIRDGDDFAIVPTTTTIVRHPDDTVSWLVTWEGHTVCRGEHHSIADAAQDIGASIYEFGFDPPELQQSGGDGFVSCISVRGEAVISQLSNIGRIPATTDERFHRIVEHIDGNPRNNAIENLVIVDSAVTLHKIYECGGCDCYHPYGWAGDCRDDAHRYAGPEDYAERNNMSLSAHILIVPETAREDS